MGMLLFMLLSIRICERWLMPPWLALQSECDPTLDCPSSREKIEDQDNYRENKQNVDPTAKRIAADKPYNPEKEENNGDRPKHDWFS
jgi:hypothetical protein